MPIAPNTSRITAATSSARCRTRCARGRERRLDALAEARAVDVLVPVGLDGADLVQRLVEVRADVADPVLASPAPACGRGARTG